MHARVTAVLVARNGAPFLQRTVAAIVAQSRRPDALVAVDAGSSDETAAMLSAANPTTFTSASSARTMGNAVAHAIRAMPTPTESDEWLWILAHDNAPQPGALAALLGAVEVAPSVAVAGPKLMRGDAPDTIAAFGESMTPGGASVQLVTNELDQAQHDRRSDLLAVAANGMLVRRRVWSALGGFDPGLPSVDAALDFCVRARLAGHRVIAVPDARVASDRGPETFERRAVSPRTLARIRRSAQLHRRLVYASGAAVVVHWLMLLPLALGRSVVHLAAKRPWAVAGELRAALGAAFDPGVAAARANLARTRSLGWSAIAPLRIQRADARELESSTVTYSAADSPELLVPRPSFFSAGGAWIVLLLALVSAIALSPLFGATALAGGGLAPLSSGIAELWQHTQWGWHDTGAGYFGPADPFALVLAVLGSVTFWSPSLAIVGLWFCAIPLAGLAAWACAARFSSRGWAPAIAAIVWALAPPFLTSLGDGHIGAVLVHVLLPWLVLSGVSAARSWSAAGAASLLFAVIGASAPSLVGALLIMWFAWLVTHPRAIGRMIWMLVPLVVVFAPLVWYQVGRGSLVALLADPGLQFASPREPTLHLAVGSAASELDGWPRLAEAVGLPGLTGVVVAVSLFAPLAVLALLGLFLPGSRRAIPAIVVAVLGFVTAVASVHLELTHLGPVTVTNWAGPGLSVYWLGLGGAIALTLDALGSAVAVPALIAGLAATGLAIPGVVAVISADAAIAASNGRMLPAFVTAQAATNPDVGTMQLTAQADGSLRVVLHRGAGTSLDEVTTVTSADTDINPEQKKLADLAGNLAAASGLNVSQPMQELQVGFVLLTDTARGGDAGVTRTRAADALDSNGSLVAVGSTDQGYLWQFVGLKPTDANRNGDAAIGVAISAGTGLIALIAVLLAIPTEIRRRPVAASGLENPADTFEEDESA